MRFGFGFAAALTLLGGCAQPPKDPASCGLIQIVSIPATITEGRQILVPGNINGARVMFQVDTGAAQSVLYAGAAQKLGLEQRRLGGARIIGVNGETAVYAAEIAKFSLGDSPLGSDRSFTMAIIGTKQMQDDGESVGLLGSDYFQHFDLEFDLAERKVNIFLPHPCPGAVAYWKHEILVESPFVLTANHILLNVTINGQTGKAMLDSGAEGTAMTWSEARRFGITRDTPGVESGKAMHGIGDREVGSSHYMIPAITIGDETVNRVPTVLFTPGGGGGIDPSGFPMLLGADFLLRNRVYIAYQEHALYFSPYRYKLAPEAVDAQ